MNIPNEYFIAAVVLVIGFLIKLLSKADSSKISPADFAIGAQSAFSSLMVVFNHLLATSSGNKITFSENKLMQILSLVSLILICTFMSRGIEISQENVKAAVDVKKNTFLSWTYSALSFVLGVGAILYALLIKTLNV